MHVRVVIDMDVSQTAADQMHRAGFEVIKEGGQHTVKLPNRIIRPGKCKVQFEDTERAAEGR